MNEFKKLREQSGMNMKKFAEHFGIPYRTVQNWEAGVNKCPEYLLKLLKFKLDHDRMEAERKEKIRKRLSEIGCVLTREEADKILFGKEFKTKNRICLYCNSSMSGDAPDGSQVLVCFNCAGHEGKEMIVGDDECCPNYNGCD